MTDASEKVQIIFYWDVFFILNFFLNFFLLGMTVILRRKYCKSRYKLLASIWGSAQITLFFWWQIWRKPSFVITKRISFSFVLVGCFVAVQMLWILFRERKIKEGIRSFATFFAVSVFTAGILFLLREQIGQMTKGSWGCIKMILVVFVLYIVIFVRTQILGRAEQQSHILDGIITDHRGEKYKVRALMDTGNQLVSPYTGEQVTIITKELAEKMQLDQTQHPVWIPFHSLGGDGLLPTYRLPYVVLQNGMEQRKFLAAVSEHISSDNTIQMIFHSKL